MSTADAEVRNLVFVALITLLIGWAFSLVSRGIRLQQAQVALKRKKNIVRQLNDLIDTSFRQLVEEQVASSQDAELLPSHCSGLTSDHPTAVLTTNASGSPEVLVSFSAMKRFAALAGSPPAGSDIMLPRAMSTSASGRWPGITSASGSLIGVPTSVPFEAEGRLLCIVDEDELATHAASFGRSQKHAAAMPTNFGTSLASGVDPASQEASLTTTRNRRGAGRSDPTDLSLHSRSASDDAVGGFEMQSFESMVNGLIMRTEIKGPDSFALRATLWPELLPQLDDCAADYPIVLALVVKPASTGHTPIAGTPIGSTSVAAARRRSLTMPEGSLIFPGTSPVPAPTGAESVIDDGGAGSLRDADDAPAGSASSGVGTSAAHGAPGPQHRLVWYFVGSVSSVVDGDGAAAGGHDALRPAHHAPPRAAVPVHKPTASGASTDSSIFGRSPLQEVGKMEPSVLKRFPVSRATGTSAGVHRATASADDDDGVLAVEPLMVSLDLSSETGVEDDRDPFSPDAASSKMSEWFSTRHRVGAEDMKIEFALKYVSVDGDLRALRDVYWMTDDSTSAIGAVLASPAPAPSFNAAAEDPRSEAPAGPQPVLPTNDTNYSSSFGETGAECIICYSEPASVITLPCRHFAICEGCVRKLSMCPICRTEVESLVTLFTSVIPEKPPGASTSDPGAGSTARVDIPSGRGRVREEVQLPSEVRYATAATLVVQGADPP